MWNSKILQGFFWKKTQNKTYPTEINKFKRRSPNEKRYLLPHYAEEVVENVSIEEKNQGFLKKVKNAVLEVVWRGERYAEDAIRTKLIENIV